VNFFSFFAYFNKFFYLNFYLHILNLVSLTKKKKFFSLFFFFISDFIKNQQNFFFFRGIFFPRKIKGKHISKIFIWVFFLIKFFFFFMKNNQIKLRRKISEIYKNI
jgi:hypothetical protein